jgi:hypothetical protein
MSSSSVIEPLRGPGTPVFHCQMQTPIPMNFTDKIFIGLGSPSVVPVERMRRALRETTDFGSQIVETLLIGKLP